MTDNEFYEEAKTIADDFINKITEGSGLTWDDLADTNSLWDYIDEKVPLAEQLEQIQDACKDRIAMDFNA